MGSWASATTVDNEVGPMIQQGYTASAWIDAFLDERMHLHGLTRSSIHTMRIELKSWWRWLDARGISWNGVTPSDIQLWLGQHRAHSDATMQKKTSILRSLYRWARQDDLVKSDPWLGIVRAHNNRRWSPRFTPAIGGVERLLAQPDVNTMIGVRDRAILELLYATGLRAAELLGLACHQVSLGDPDRIIAVMGKGQKERIVIYNQITQTWLRYYLRVARPQLLIRAGASPDHTPQFFVQHRPAGGLSYPVLRRMIRGYANAAGLPLLTAHSLRHAFASHLYQGGANLRVVQELLGHSHLATTCAYARPATDLMREFIERFHPRGIHYDHSLHRQRQGTPARRVAWLQQPVQDDSPVLIDRWLIKTAT